MKIHLFTTADEANCAAADLVTVWLTSGARNVMLAAGNTPLDLYQRIAERRLNLSHVNLFALDEYVGVPREEPRNCANLIARTAAGPWGIPSHQYFSISSVETEALDGVQKHEWRIAKAGGLDLLVLGLGQNGHLGFNEPGSEEDSTGRVLELNDISVEANRKWFNGDYAPARGVTAGMKTILSARRIAVLAYGDHKAAAVRSMTQGQRSPACPASLLQGHPETHLFLDEAAAAGLPRNP